MKIPHSPEIRTERLRIIPLSYKQLKKYLQKDFSLEKELGLQHVPRYVPEDLEEVLEEVILPSVLKSEPDHLFHTLWTLIEDKANNLVGDLCFKGKPNQFGEVEIGYGVHEYYRNRGFMTEAIEGMIGWLNRYPTARVMTAETKIDNIASQRTLEKLGFRLDKETENECWWRLSLP